ncbi:unnamed protein product [Linum tenue]|uniref:Uncharacterized protein n=1 Tax=Linum tenue TaxID=586396 RepID=A0AAV0H4K5_9ROSI|nr:unnamed protein product [Linum tenue]
MMRSKEGEQKDGAGRSDSSGHRPWRSTAAKVIRWHDRGLAVTGDEERAKEGKRVNNGSSELLRRRQRQDE